MSWFTVQLQNHLKSRYMLRVGKAVGSFPVIGTAVKRVLAYYSLASNANRHLWGDRHCGDRWGARRFGVGFSHRGEATQSAVGIC